MNYELLAQYSSVNGETLESDTRRAIEDKLNRTIKS